MSKENKNNYVNSLLKFSKNKIFLSPWTFGPSGPSGPFVHDVIDMRNGPYMTAAMRVLVATVGSRSWPIENWSGPTSTLAITTTRTHYTSLKYKNYKTLIRSFIIYFITNHSMALYNKLDNYITLSHMKLYDKFDN